MPLPTHLEPLCTAFIRGLDAVLGDKLYAVYLLGAIAFPEGDASGDVDFHVIVREPLTGGEKAGLTDLHATLARDYPPSGADMDISYLLLDDARRTTPPVLQFPPGFVDQSWALHCAHMRAGRCIRLRGPDPTEIYPVVSWPELEAALWHEHDFVAKHLTEYPDYCILNLCRLMYSFQTHVVVISKRFSAAWARAAFPQWSPLIDGALASYDRGHPGEDQALLAARIAPFHEFAMEQIHASLGRAQPGGATCLTFRHPAPDDAVRVLELMIRRDVEEVGQADSSLEDLQYDWDHMNLERDAWLAVTAEGGLAGYAAVVPWMVALRYDVYVDQPWQGARREVGQDLLARCQARGAELVRDESCQPLARMYIAHANADERVMVEAAGFRPVQYHFQMQIEMEAPPQPPEWPAGVKVRTAVPGRDDRAIHALIQAAFDRPGRTPQSFEAWQEFMMQPWLFEADLWFLAEADGDLAGACLCFAYPEMGWVRQLGVAKGQRQRGLGTALLRHALCEFWKREVGLVGLAVNAENETAVGLYEAAGMKCIQQYDEYQQTVLPAS